MGPGNSLGVSVAFPSFTFPSRFRYVSVKVSTAFSVAFPFPSTFPSRFRRVSVAVPFAFPLRFRWASACPRETTPQKLAQHCGAAARGRPSRSETKTVLAQWLRPRLVTCGLGFDLGCRRFEACPPICCQQRRVCALGATRAQGSH